MEGRIIADTSGIIALLDKNEQHHAAAVEIVRKNNIVIPVTVLPEVDYLATKYLGERVARAFLEDLVEGSFTYLSVELEDLAQASCILLINAFTAWVFPLPGEPMNKMPHFQGTPYA